MNLSVEQKARIKSRIAERLAPDSKIVRVVVFGSFVNSDFPSDIDIAVFVDS